MIRKMIAGWQWPDGTPQRPQRCKFFADEQFTELCRRKDGEVLFFVLWYHRLRLKKILQRLFVFRTKLFIFRDYFVNIV